MTKILYSENQNSPWWTWLLAGVFLSLSVGTLVAWAAYPLAPWTMLAIPLIIIVLFVFLLINFTSLKILITDQQVDVSFGLFHRRIDRRRIRKVRQISARWGEVWGLGIRFGPKGENLWNAQFGDAVRLDCQDQKRPFAFSTSHPDQIIKILINKN